MRMRAKRRGDQTKCKGAECFFHRTGR
jgi:hypothetical protein